MGFQTPKFCGEDIFFNIKDQEIKVSEIILNRIIGMEILKRKQDSREWGEETLGHKVSLC